MSKPFNQQIRDMATSMMRGAGGGTTAQEAANNLALRLVREVKRFDPARIMVVGLSVYVVTTNHAAKVEKGEGPILLLPSEEVPPYAYLGGEVKEATPEIRQAIRKSIGLRLVL